MCEPTIEISRLILRFLMIFVIALGSGCAKDRDEKPVYNYEEYLAELNEKKIDRYMGIRPVSMETKDDWEVYHYGPDSQAICLTGTEFIASLRRADPGKIVLYLEGGGACWDYESCYEIGLAKRTAGAPPGGFEGGGFLQKNNEQNPLKDWSVIYASYCDGSIWSGDNDVYYNDRLTHHHGLSNLSAALTLLIDNFPAPQKILVTGSSAGGYGTLMGYFLTRTQFPYMALHVLNDSGPYVENQDNTYMHDAIRQNWKIDQFLPEECPRCDEQLFYMVNWILDRDLTVRWGLFSYYDDIVIGSIFLGLGPDFRTLLIDVTDDINEAHPDTFKRFIVEGVLHTTMTLPTYYSLNLDGIYFYQWVEQLVNDSPDWSDLLE